MGRNIYKRRDLLDWKDQVGDMVYYIKTLLLTFLLCVTAFSAAAEDNRFLTASIIRARALAMGSAYHSLIDDFSAGLYNPGAFKLNRTREGHSFRFFFNPVGMFISFYDYSKYNRDFARDDKLTVYEGFSSASMILKGAVFTTQMFDFGFNLGEEIITSDSLLTHDERFFSIEEQSHGSFNSAFVNFKVSSSVSLGVTGTLYRSRTSGNTTYKGGYTFGVLLKPNPKLNVGIAYNKIPQYFSNGRFLLESIEGETVTGGISYYPSENTILSIDLRNLNKEDKQATREIHAGFERYFRERIALRAGYYRKKLTQNDVYSFGIGILPTWEKISKFINSSRNDTISYTLIIEENGEKNNWHIFSLLLRY